MRRRDFFAAAGAGIVGAGASVAAMGQEPLTSHNPDAGSYGSVVAQARELAAAPYEARTMELTGPFADLGYDSYRGIRPRTIPLGPERHGFAIDLLPPGFIYKEPVQISLVSAAGVEDIRFSPEMFDFDPDFFDAAALSEWAPAEGLEFSGVRLRHGINQPDHLDEFAVFQGASYFRATARNMIYGLSARGLALRTGDPKGEEFPVFRHFWIERPTGAARSIAVRALLDSTSCAGAFEFVITPGEATVTQTRCTLFPRVELEQVGIAPLTSMFVFGPQWRAGVDDFRNAVHDSEGLQMLTGQSARLWRPLTNPRQLQISAFQDSGPTGFGLVQRRRDFAHYSDAEARYEKRPAGWVEPAGDWGDGAVVLVEIPTAYEFNDNMVAFWRPSEPLGPTEEGHEFAYWLHWCGAPPDAAPLARVHATRSGRSIHDESRRVLIIDFSKPGRLAVPPEADVAISKGEITGLTVRDLPGGDLTRVSFEFTPGEEPVLEFQVALVGPEGPVSERWIYRWTPA
ncbi:MAG TPA: glucan biosynthesis protein G [Paracoccaceae bacterium]|nr:glucan biosynthesis protein G [Paracoccaceae bacterium]